MFQIAKRHFLRNFIHVANATVKESVFFFSFFKSPRKVQVAEHARAEPKNDAEMKHTVPITLGFIFFNYSFFVCGIN